jgi:hypothetical protein
MSTPAGWYPDPAGSSRNRWWDGATWTENFHDPLAAAQVNAPALKAPEGTSAYNPYILTMIVLLVVSFLSIFIAANPTTLAAAVEAESSDAPATTAELISNIINFALYVAWVVLAYFDHRALKNAGVPQPFHWAWTFLAAPIVYFIGRGVVTRRRTGSGIATMWIAIGYLIATFIAVIVLIVAVVGIMIASGQFS